MCVEPVHVPAHRALPDVVAHILIKRLLWQLNKFASAGEVCYFCIMSLPVCFAPLQGYTDAVYRCAHASLFGGVTAYYTPFVRIEKDDFRRKDLRDIAPENNRGVAVVPQIIASHPDELRRLVDGVAACGYRRIDINLGCPFPMLARRHKGSGILPFPDEVERLLRPLEGYGGFTFSVKMRLGWESPDESLRLLPLFESLSVRQITLHARLGRQQYKGEPDREAFARFYEVCRLPLLYNGDLVTVDDIQSVERQFPRLSGVMVGRGLLARPWLAEAYTVGSGAVTGRYERVERLHNRVFDEYGAVLQGAHQLLTRMAVFWEYLLPEVDRRLRKRVLKARSIDEYVGAVRTLWLSLSEKRADR